MKKIVKNLTNDELIQICNEIYEWKWAPGSNGDLNPESSLKKLYMHKKDSLISMNYLEKLILFEAHSRFSNMVKTLFIDNPALYIK